MNTQGESLEWSLKSAMAVRRMNETFHPHVPVLLKEAVTALVQKEEGIYLDATFGRGSHSEAILNKLSAKGQLIAFDKDPEAVAYAKKHFSKDSRFKIFHQSFAEMQTTLKELNLEGKIDGILFDLGVSSPQLDDKTRGFSFSHDAQLDMRMDTTQALDAAKWLNAIDEETLANVLFNYGEERYARRIARAITTIRKETPITHTHQLADIIAKAIPRWPRDKHPATRSFQAIRIAVNQELEELTLALEQSLPSLSLSGRLVVISFHSLEDRIVKQFIKSHEKGTELPRGLPVKTNSRYFRARLKAIGKAIKPTPKEISQNPRARSAILRIAEKCS